MESPSADEDEDVVETLTLDETTYQLMAVRTFGGYHGTWHCNECHFSDYCQVHNSPEEAIAAALGRAGAHHAKIHGQQPKNLK